VTGGIHRELNSTYGNSLATMKGEKITKMFFVLMQKRNLLARHLDRVMDLLIPSGIPDCLSQYGLSDIYRRLDLEEPDSRRVLSLSDVEFGFVIWLATFPFPIAVFINEVLTVKVEEMIRAIRELAGFFQFFMLLKARMKAYHG
jgi:hypothetical protein